MTSFLAALCTLVPAVTVQMRAQPLSLLLPALSAKLNRPLSVQSALAREWLVIDAKDVEPDALLTRIAEVTHAQWIPEKGEIRLRRLPETDRALATAERKFHSTNLQGQWREAIKAPYDPANEARKSGSKVVPMHRYLREFLLQIPIDAITRLESGHGFVFASRPRGSQRPFPASAVPLVGRLLRDHETFTSIAGPRMDEEANGGVPTRVVLRVHVTRATPGQLTLTSSLNLRDAQGGEVDEATGYFASPETPDVVRREKELLPLSPVSKELESLRRSGDEEDGRPINGRLAAASPEAKAAILRPESDGMLTRTWSDVLFGLATRESLPLVAHLPDAAESMNGLVQNAKASIDAHLDLLSATEIRREGGWLTLRPRFPGPAGRARADRAVAGKIVKAGFEGRAISMEEAAALIPKLDPNLDVIQFRNEVADTTGSAATATFDQDRTGLEIIRCLGANHRTALYAGTSLAFASLPDELQRLLRTHYLESSEVSGYQAAGSADEGESSSADLTERIDAAQVAGLMLQIGVKEELGFIIWPFPESTYRFASSAEHLVFYMDKDLGLEPVDEADNIDAARFQVMSQRTIRLQIRFPNGDREEIRLNDTRLDPKAPFLSLDKLPPAIRAQLRRLKDEELKRYKGDG